MENQDAAKTGLIRKTVLWIGLGHFFAQGLAWVARPALWGWGAPMIAARAFLWQALSFPVFWLFPRRLCVQWFWLFCCANSLFRGTVWGLVLSRCSSRRKVSA